MDVATGTPFIITFFATKIPAWIPVVGNDDAACAYRSLGIPFSGLRIFYGRAFDRAIPNRICYGLYCYRPAYFWTTGTFPSSARPHQVLATLRSRDKTCGTGCGAFSRRCARCADTYAAALNMLTCKLFTLTVLKQRILIPCISVLLLCLCLPLWFAIPTSTRLSDSSYCDTTALDWHRSAAAVCLVRLTLPKTLLHSIYVSRGSLQTIRNVVCSLVLIHVRPLMVLRI